MKTFFETTSYKSNIIERLIDPIKNENGFNENIIIDSHHPINMHQYTWDEPFMRNKHGRNVLEVIIFVITKYIKILIIYRVQNSK